MTLLYISGDGINFEVGTKSAAWFMKNLNVMDAYCWLA